MNHRESPLYWSLPCGTWFQTRLRISVYFPLLVLLIGWQLDDFQLGLVFSAILLLSVLMHEFGHVVAARSTGGSGDEVLVWPLGGLAFVQPNATFRSRLLTPAAGPLVNLLLCGITFPVVYGSGFLSEALHPLRLPTVAFEEQLAQDLLLLLFCANWILLLVNLVPVYPLDGGRMLQSCLMPWLGSETATEVYIKIGFFVAFLAMIAGLMQDSTWLVAIGAIVLVMNMQESQQLRSGEVYDESFMGYDFSQGYTSLERSEESCPRRRPGLLERWRERRRAHKLQRTRQKQAQIEQQLDAILEKVHTQGIDSLTDAERRQLNRASARFRNQGKTNE